MAYKSVYLGRGTLAQKLEFYNDVVKRGRAEVEVTIRDGVQSSYEVVCTVSDDDKTEAMQQYQIYGWGGFSKLLSATGEFSVRWNKHFPGKLFTFKRV